MNIWAKHTQELTKYIANLSIATHTGYQYFNELTFTNSTLIVQVLTLSSNLAKANLEIFKLKIAAAASNSASNSTNTPNWDPSDYCWFHGFKVHALSTYMYSFNMRKSSA